MDVSTLLPLLTGPVAALAVLIWWVLTQRSDIAELRKIVEAERRRADSAEEAARTANALLGRLFDQSLTAGKERR